MFSSFAREKKKCSAIIVAVVTQEVRQLLVTFGDICKRGENVFRNHRCSHCTGSQTMRTLSQLLLTFGHICKRKTSFRRTILKKSKFLVHIALCEMAICESFVTFVLVLAQTENAFHNPLCSHHYTGRVFNAINVPSVRPA